jgi:histidinol-phosphate aminotransferase
MKSFRSAILRMQGYVPGFQPKEGGFIKLNTNENPYPPSQKVFEALKESFDASLRLYPDPMSDPLREEIAETLHISKDCIMVGNGSDELLNIAVRAILGKNDKLFITEPTYILYEVLAAMQEAKIIRCKLDQYFDFPKKINARDAKLVMISNPNTPTGKVFSPRVIEKLCRETKGFVLLDEAYADFSKENSMNLVKKYKNVMVTRSFSKSYALAGLRIGYLAARPEVIEEFMKLKDSYNVNRLSQAAALAALKDRAWFRETISRVIRDREMFSAELEKLGFSVIPSEANFIFVRHPKIKALDLYQQLYDKKILVRHFNRERLREYLRISIGTHQEMIKVLKVIQKMLYKSAR